MNGPLNFKQCSPKLLFFVNVENAREVKERVIKAELPCAVINPRYVLDEFQVLVATQIAVTHHHNQTMKTRSVFSEIIYNLSPNKKISDSLKMFGINDNDTEILCVVLDEGSSEQVKAAVKGELCDIKEIISRRLCSEEEVKKIYKIKDEELKVGQLLDAVINRISSKDIVTF